MSAVKLCEMCGYPVEELCGNCPDPKIAALSESHERLLEAAIEVVSKLGKAQHGTVSFWAQEFDDLRAAIADAERVKG